MRGLIIKDYLTIKKKYGVVRLILDTVIIAALFMAFEGSGAIMISFLLIPIEVMSMVISLATCDEQWKWGKYAISLPVSKRQIVKSRYVFTFLLSLVGFLAVLFINTAAYFCFPKYTYGFYLFTALASLGLTLLFLSMVLPSNYLGGANAGFVVMLVFVVLLVVLGLWTKLVGADILSFVVNNFGICMVFAFVGIVILWNLSYIFSAFFFRRKYI